MLQICAWGGGPARSYQVNSIDRRFFKTSNSRPVDVRELELAELAPHDRKMVIDLRLLLICRAGDMRNDEDACESLNTSYLAAAMAVEVVKLPSENSSREG